MATDRSKLRATPKGPGLLVVGGDPDACKRITELFGDSEHPVSAVYSAPHAVADVLRGVTQVVILDVVFLGPRAGDLVALLKRCNPRLRIILLADDTTLPLLVKLRREGIFYHALHPTSPEDDQEIREAVRCAFDSAP